MKKVLLALAYGFTVLLFLVGLVIYLYPAINRYTMGADTRDELETFRALRADTTQATEASARPEETVPAETEPRVFPELYADMEKYNADIRQENQSGLADAWSYEQAVFDLSRYGISNGAVAELRIPKLDLDLPVYLGATMGNLSRGAAQLGQTSMPIGGTDTNCVIAGHRGSTAGDFFLHLDELEPGDLVYLDNFWETLTYRVEETKIIQPEEVDQVLIQEGRDMVTLVTCHPYPGHAQRYAVYCVRVEQAASVEPGEETTAATTAAPEPTVPTQSGDAPEQPGVDTSRKVMALEKILNIAVPLLLVALIVLLRRRRS